MLDLLLQQLAAEPHAPLDLAEVALYLATDEYPDLFVPDYLTRLDQLADAAPVPANAPLEEQVTVFCQYLFEEQQFIGNAEDYYDPRNSYLNDVLDRRTGLPITLSILAISVGIRIGLDIVGIGLPGHFIALAREGEERVLFDPFHGGQLLTLDGCRHLVEAVTGQPYAITSEILTPTPNAVIVLRLLNNLKSIYAQQADYHRTARVLTRQWQLNPRDLNIRRDLGITLVRGERPGQAIDHLQVYLTQASMAADAEDIRLLLNQAKRDVARWN